MARSPAARRQVCTEVNPWSTGCPSRRILDLVADKWVMLLLPLLREGPRRNAELLRGAEGVSQKMLVQTLRSLEEHGLVARRDHGEVPPRVEYSLTPLGASLATTLEAVDDWVVDHFTDVDAARRSYRRPRTPSRPRIPLEAAARATTSPTRR